MSDLPSHPPTPSSSFTHSNRDDGYSIGDVVALLQSMNGRLDVLEARSLLTSRGQVPIATRSPCVIPVVLSGPIVSVDSVPSAASLNKENTAVRGALPGVVKQSLLSTKVLAQNRGDVLGTIVHPCTYVYTSAIEHVCVLAYEESRQPHPGGSNTTCSKSDGSTIASNTVDVQPCALFAYDFNNSPRVVDASEVTPDVPLVPCSTDHSIVNSRYGNHEVTVDAEDNESTLDSYNALLKEYDEYLQKGSISCNSLNYCYNYKTDCSLYMATADSEVDSTSVMFYSSVASSLADKHDSRVSVVSGLSDATVYCNNDGCENLLHDLHSDGESMTMISSYGYNDCVESASIATDDGEASYYMSDHAVSDYSSSQHCDGSSDDSIYSGNEASTASRL
jgi:hypothetical protein